MELLGNAVLEGVGFRVCNFISAVSALWDVVFQPHDGLSLWSPQILPSINFLVMAFYRNLKGTDMVPATAPLTQL